jgi:AcrR family transcriptional regulator
MPRPLQFDKDKALEKAMNIFWHKGYEATSLQDLLEGMKLFKSSFYQSFGKKEDLFKSCLSHYRNRLARDLTKAIERAPSAMAFLETYFADLSDNKHKDSMKGCMIMNTATEFSQTNPTIAQLVKDGMNQLEMLFESVIRQAQKEGDVPSKKDPQSLAQFLVSNISGLKTLAKAGAPKQTLTNISNTVLQTLKKS